MNTRTISKRHQISPISAFFLLISLQIGSDYLKLPRPLSDAAGQDAWIGILISGLATLGMTWLLFRLLENEREFGRTDLFSIHRRVFGKWIGGVLNFILLAQVLLYVVQLIRSYTMIFQVWLIPNLSTLEFSILICCIAGYVVMGGIRHIAGLALFNFIFMIPFFQMLHFTVPYLRFSNLLPIFDHSLASIAQASYFGAKLYLGFELIVFFYPFLSEPQKARKWAYFGVLTTMILYLNLTIVGTAFAAQGVLRNMIWPLMSLLKTLQIPFFNHAEEMATLFFVWGLVPNICLCIWVLTRGLKFTFPKMKQNYLMIGLLILVAGSGFFITCGNHIRILKQVSGSTGVAIVYLYFPLLLFCQWLSQKVRKTSR